MNKKILSAVAIGTAFAMPVMAQVSSDASSSAMDSSSSVAASSVASDETLQYSTSSVSAEDAADDTGIGDTLDESMTTDAQSSSDFSTSVAGFTDDADGDTTADDGTAGTAGQQPTDLPNTGGGGMATNVVD